MQIGKAIAYGLEMSPRNLETEPMLEVQIELRRLTSAIGGAK